MKKLISYILNKLTSGIINRFHDLLTDFKLDSTSDQVSQLILKNQYKSIDNHNTSDYSFEEVGFRKYSQNSEDGIILYIFSRIGCLNRTVVEICASDGIQCNSANLIINHGWKGLLFDGDLNSVNKGRAFYAKHPDTFTLPPTFVHAWITRDNINSLITENKTSGEIDLLSIDMDGVDYWIWDALECISPRMVVAEVQCIWGKDISVTVPYSENFKTKFVNNFGIYCGASIAAFIGLANKKGYRLIGFEKYGFNAFFMRNDVGIDCFPEINTVTYEDIPFVKWAKSEFLHLVQDMEWQKI